MQNIKKLIIMVLMVVAVPNAYSAIEIDMDAITRIESSNNPLAYNAKSKATGLYQITPICLLHYNKVHGTEITMAQLFNERINTMVAKWYFSWLISRCDSVREVLISYNYGYKHRHDKRLPIETETYLKMYEVYHGQSERADNESVNQYRTQDESNV